VSKGGRNKLQDNFDWAWFCSKHNSSFFDFT